MPNFDTTLVRSQGFAPAAPVRPLFRISSCRYINPAMDGKYLIATLGCKVNQYESQEIRETLECAGLRPAEIGQAADLAVVNTCAVTARATAKSRQIVRRLARLAKSGVVVVGCGASADAQVLGAIKGVTAVLGHDNDIRGALRHVLGRLFTASDEEAIPLPKQGIRGTNASSQTAATANANEVWMNPYHKKTSEGTTYAMSSVENTRSGHDPLGEPAGLSPGRIMRANLPVVNTPAALDGRIERFDGHLRAFLKVQDGCDAHCTYCIIPRLRSVVRSKPIETAVEEARSLVRAGHREIVITGIFLGAYGQDTALRKRFRPRKSALAHLVRALDRVEGLARLRLSSLEPGDVDEELLEAIGASSACVPHLHLPLQSGSPDILRRMNRQYTQDNYLDMIDRARSLLDHPAISTDIIVGFPGETEADFEASLFVARYANFVKIHAFPFSPRQGTAAARWRKQFVPHEAVQERMSRLAEAERECSYSFRRDMIGCSERVLIEKIHAAPPGPRGAILTGHADRYFCVDVHDPHPGIWGIGNLVETRITRVTHEATVGIPLSHRTDADLSLPLVTKTDLQKAGV